MAKTALRQLAIIAVDSLEKGVASEVVAKQMASVLLDERRSRETASLMRAIEKELARRGNIQVTITSATKIDSSVRDQLANALGVTKPFFHEVIDESVIGGVKANVLDQELDLTIKGKLTAFKQSLSKGK